MAEAADSWYSSFSWRNNILDILLVGWIGWAVLISLLINGVVNFFGPLAREPLFDRARRAVEGATSGAGKVSATHENCQWLNSALKWFHLHYHQTPEFMNSWVLVLNDQLKKLGGPVGTVVGGIQPSSLPPKFTDIQYEILEEDFIIHMCVESTDIVLTIFASQESHEGVKLTNCNANIQRLRGHMKLRSYKKAGLLLVEASFVGRPTVNLSVKPESPYSDINEIVDLAVVEEVLRNSISLSTVVYTLSGGGSMMVVCPPDHMVPPPHASHHQQQPSSSSAAVPVSNSPREEALFEPIEASKVHSVFKAPVPSQAPVIATEVPPSPSRPQRFVGDRRLLVKLIKGSGLGANLQGTCNPFCAICLDNPEQVYYTSVAANTVHPFWDEHFLFDITDHSSVLTFEVFDKNKPAGEDFLGEAVIYYDDLRKTPSSRQIIPLQCPPGINDFVSGTLTVEFLSLSPSEAKGIENSLLSRNMVNKQPASHAQQDRLDANINGNPNFIGNELDLSDFSNRSSPYTYSTYDQSPSSASETQQSGLDKIVPTIEHSAEEHQPASAKAQRSQSDREKKGSFADTIRRKFQRKRRSRSADRSSSSFREGSLLKPPEQSYGPKSKDDLELVRPQAESPNLKKSRSLGGSLKKLFRRGRKRSRSRGDTSRESSFSRSSNKNAPSSQGPSRESSLPRSGAPQRASDPIS